MSAEARDSRCTCRNPYDETTVRQDKPNQRVIDLVHMLDKAGHYVVFMSGRSAGCQDDTLEWLQLTKRETIQARKDLIIVERSTDKVYTGPQVRDMLGLPAMETRVSPEFNPKFDIYVMSTSVNRMLMPGTKLLLLTGS